MLTDGKSLANEVKHMESQLSSLKAQQDSIQKALEQLQPGGSKYEQLLKQEQQKQQQTITSEIEKLSLQISNLKQQKQSIQKEIEQIQKQIQKLDTQISYDCQLTNQPCPFLKEILSKFAGLEE